MKFISIPAAQISRLLMLFSIAILAGCASTPPVPTAPPSANGEKYSAVSQDSRVQFLVLHFTAENLALSLKYLTEGPVSSHYLVTDEPIPRVLTLVDESRRAYHAGESSWGPSVAGLNAASIGIEIVNLGSRVAGFQDYPPAQIDAVIALVKDIVKRHQIPPHRVVGHSDIAPQRKDDPGAKFPWHRLAAEGLIPWPSPDVIASKRVQFEAQLPDVTWFQKKLAAYGYATPQTGTLDTATRKVIAAFQMRHRPARYDGTPDAESAAILDALPAYPK
jgi:N-acetylmuramoyl-L-alanine amidase